MPVFVIGTLQPSWAVAKPKVTIPTFSSAGKHFGSEGAGTTVVAGIVASLSIHGTLAATTGFGVEVTCTFVVDCSEVLAEPQDDKIAADIRKASGHAVGFLPMSVEV